MAQNLNNTSEQFNEKEPRNAAFKALFSVLQTTTFNTLDAESFSKGFPTFPDEIIYEADTIKFSNNEGDENIIPSRTRTWITGSSPTDQVGDSAETLISNRLERLLRGHFETQENSDVTSNPYVEKNYMSYI